jgi:hypothetical protein
MIRAGLPTTIALGGTERVTTEPASTIAFLPIMILGSVFVFAQIEAPLQIQVIKKTVRCTLLLGNILLVKVELGRIKTSSSRVTPYHICMPHFMVTRSPMVTLFSIKPRRRY